MSFLTQLPKSIFLRICLLVNALIALMLLLSYLAPYISPDTSYWIALLGLGYPPLLLSNLFAIAWWLYWRSRLVYLSLFSVILGTAHIFNFWGVAGNTPVPPTGTLRVLSYNVHYFGATAKRSNEETIQQERKILDYIREQKPDIFCAQEFSGRIGDHTQYAYTYMQHYAAMPYGYLGGGSNLAIYSKYPIINQGTISFINSYNGAIFADIQLPTGKPIRVYCMHLQSIQLGADSEEVLKRDNLLHLRDEKTREKYKRIGSKLHRAFLMRTEQVEMLAAHIRQSPYPVILAGDLNDTPLSYAYKRICNTGLRDSFWERGIGTGSTYAGSLPFLRIDYIFAGKGLKIYSHQVLPKALSDHYAVFSLVGR